VRRAELFTAAMLVVAGLGALGVLIPRYVVDAPESVGLSPRFMPYAAAALATASALHLLVAALLRGDDSGGPAPFTLENLRFACATAAVLGGSYVLMSLLGYLAGAAALVAGMLLVARAPLLTIVVTAVAAPVALWLVFARLLATPLP
jgi:hypothetical protein